MNQKLKKLASYYRPYLGLFFTDMFFAILGAAITLVIPLIVRYITENVITQEPDAAMLKIVRLGIFMLILVLVECYCNYFMIVAENTRDLSHEMNWPHICGAKIYEN